MYNFYFYTSYKTFLIYEYDPEVQKIANTSLDSTVSRKSFFFLFTRNNFLNYFSIVFLLSILFMPVFK